MRSAVEEAIGETVRVAAGGVNLIGNLEVPAGAKGVVLFAHGSGSGRHSPRNRFVAGELNRAGIATLLLDLLTLEEEEEDAYTGHLRFDVEMLAGRLEEAGTWLASQPTTAGLSVGYFGASTGAAAALIAAAKRPDAVTTVVSRGGRPDLAGSALERVHCPTLLLVGGNDGPVVGMNRDALRRLAAPVKKMVIIPGASHLFEEPGTLDEVARRAADWFTRYLAPEAHVPTVFRDRAQAGRLLAKELYEYASREDLVVLALPRGGVPVGYEVAKALHAPLDVIVVRKLGMPGQEELAMGAIASGGVRVINNDVVNALGIDPELIDEAAHREEEELRRRELAYRGNRPPIAVAGKTVLVVDDGLATGSTMKAAVAALRHLRPREIVVAVPVAAPEACRQLRELADDAVCLRTPDDFMAVGMWYEDFRQTTDAEVRQLLEQAE